MPTQLLTRAEVVAGYGPVLAGFAPAPADHPLAAGLPAGSVTDDTEQALLLARCLVSGAGRVDPRTWAGRLAEWQVDLARRGSADLLGPSTRAALAAVAAGTPPEQAGAHGDTNGAAMRVTPVGIATAPGPRLADAVAAVSRVTHGTDVALSGATAVAAAVSTGVDGADVPGAVQAALVAAPAGAALGRGTDAPPLAPLIAAAVERTAAGRAGGVGPAGVSDIIAAEVGTGMAVTESVPAAFAALAAVPDDPWTACRVAASVGGDSDTIAALVGAIAGACHGAAALPSDAIELVLATNGLDRAELTGLAGALLDLRRVGR